MSKTTHELTDEQAAAIGAKIVELLELRIWKNEDGAERISTTWGSKTPAGLARVVARIIDQETAPDA